ncbi:hypothetical protein BDN72DRAFT_962779 [Pluteus cervinus]|uniref:Uncharacterized protein n=1 Tax=Pluteus cervinus TaxID=181527 RepID=A0ACD3AGQ3_9AGAR|nr:hypothetical protein BDN72DRAFT_962779 [Pluteus cervinus]
MHMITNPFPLELVEHIISYIDEDPGHLSRRTALVDCCRVSRVWRLAAQPKLYSYIPLMPKTRRTKSLDGTFKQFPHLRRYVKALCLTGYLNTECQNLISSVQSLPNLESLRLLSLSFPPSAPGPTLQAQLPNLFRSKHLTSLSLSALRDVQGDLLYHCGALENLALRRTTFFGLDAAAATSEGGSHKARLQCLIICCVGREEVEILDWMMNPRSAFDVGYIETFESTAIDRSDDGNSFGTICKFVSHISGSLRNVVMDPPILYNRSTAAELTNMLKSDELESLRVATISLVQELEWPYNNIDLLLSLLSNLPYPDTLEELILPTCFQGNSITTAKKSLREARWPNVENLICSRFPNLKSVHIKCFVPNTLLTGSDIPALLRRCLPVLSDRDILSFDNYSHHMYAFHMENGWFD